MISVNEEPYKMRCSIEYEPLIYTGCAVEEERKIRANLTTAEIQRFKAILLVKREEILGNVTCMETEALRRQRSDLSNMPFHMADVGTDNYEIENTLGLMDSERKLLTEIDDALDRIENGTYGICEGTDRLIPKQRLRAIPWARYCVEYANMLEKGLVKNSGYLNDTNYDYGQDNQDENPTEPFRKKTV